MVDHGRLIRRLELSDAVRVFVRVLLPESLQGRKRLDDRTVLNGIVWKFPVPEPLDATLRAWHMGRGPWLVLQP
jgi:transposase